MTLSCDLSRKAQRRLARERLFTGPAVDLTITAANIIAGSGANNDNGTAGETITAGQCLYLDSSDSKYKLADSNAAGKDVVAGISLHAALNGQPIKFITGGNLAMGAILTVGETYCLSETPGGIAPIADLATGEKVSILGVATTTSNLAISRNNTGVAKP